MAKNISLGIMEQPVMRQEEIDPGQERQIVTIFDNVTHVAGKYLGTIALLKERIKTFGQDKPTVLHGQYLLTDEELINLADPEFKEQLGDEFAGIIEMFDPELISFHLGFACEKLRSAGQYGPVKSLSPLLPKDVIRDRIVENIAFIEKNYLQRGQMLLENIDYYPSSGNCHFEHVCDPAFITEVLQESNCNMLLDIAHANCSSCNMGFKDFMTYCCQLPLEKVVEIHISSTDMQNGLVNDAHLPITEPGKAELDYLEELIKCERLSSLAMLTLETFEDVVPQLKKLKDLLERNGYTVKPLRPEPGI